MYQPMLLLAEIVILGVNIYFFWLIRKYYKDIQTRIFDINLAKDEIQTSPGPTNMKMAKDVAALLTELQSAAKSVRENWLRQQNAMQTMLSEAQETRADLENLLARVETMPAEPVVAAPAAVIPMAASSGPAASASSGLEVSPSMSLTEAMEKFGESIVENGRSEATANRILSHIRGFAQWWGGHRYEQMRLRRIGTDESEIYFDYLQSQDYQPNTIKRKMNALKAFIGWTNDVLDEEEEALLPAVPVAASPGDVNPEPANTPAAAPAPQPIADRKTMVLNLAQQGLDQRTIAAKTGMEQEAVRMLLATGF